MVHFILFLLTLTGYWTTFQKMGHEGWEGIIPIYNVFIVFKELYGSGWKILLLLIPFYNIYLLFKFHIDLAKRFNLRGVFGVGLVLLPWFFAPLLGFGGYVYQNGTKETRGTDPISQLFGKVQDTTSTVQEDSIEKRLKELYKLYKQEIITVEEYRTRKERIIDEI